MLVVRESETKKKEDAITRVHSQPSGWVDRRRRAGAARVMNRRRRTEDGGDVEAAVERRASREKAPPPAPLRPSKTVITFALTTALVTFACVKNDLYAKIKHPEFYKTVDAARGTARWVIEERVSAWNGVGAHAAEFPDEFGLRRVRSMCDEIAVGSLSATYWPLNVNSSGFSDSRALCDALDDLPGTLSLYTLKTPSVMRLKYAFAAKIPTFNRGYGVETYLAREIARGPFATRSFKDATALFIPVRPYLQRLLTVEAYVMRDPIKGTNNNAAVRQAVRDRLSRDIERVKAINTQAWTSKHKCARVVITNIDIGLSAFDSSDDEVRHGAVVITGNSELPIQNPEDAKDDQARARRANAVQAGFDPDRDVAIWFGMSSHLPREVVRMGALKSTNVRTIEVSFRGSMYRGGVRRVVFPILKQVGAERGWDLSTSGQDKPRDYMTLLSKSRYCLYVYGDRAHTARLYDIITFGCVPVIVADGYDLPFSWLFDWSKFSVRVLEDDVAKLPRILDHADYESLHGELVKVHSFFQYHARRSVFGDAFWITMLGVRRQLAKCTTST